DRREMRRDRRTVRSHACKTLWRMTQVRFLCRPSSALWVWFGRRDLDERVIKAAAAAPVRGLFRGEHVDGAPRAARIDEPAERHPGDAGADAVGHRAYGAHLAALVPHADRVAAGQPPRARVLGMDLDEELSGAPPKRLDVAVAGVQEVERLARDQLQAVRRPNLTRPGQRIVPLLEERFRVELRFSGPRREAAVCERPPILGAVQPRVSFFPEALEGDAVEPW